MDGRTYTLSRVLLNQVDRQAWMLMSQNQAIGHSFAVWGNNLEDHMPRSFKESESCRIWKRYF